MFRQIIVICIGTLILTTGIARADIRITEIAWMGTTESQFGEWFELYNDGSGEVDLSGWKLFEDQGAQLVFSLTKKILANEYLLVERTTTSSPDPVPNINDELGPFSGSGFANTGEDLVLKDSQGASVQTLSFSSGWPAGDSDTKQTMQWNGSKWVTAIATPKAPLQGGGGEPEEAQSGSTYIPKKIGPKIEIFVPDNIYTTVSSEYSARTFLEYEEVYNGIFLWNMGDGTVYKTNNPTPVKHTYIYPGSYTISFAYYRTPYDKKPVLFDSVDREVVSPKVIFSVISNKGFQFTNTDNNPIDLSSWVIVLPGQTIELPPFTIVGAKKTIVMPFSSFELSTSPISAVLQTPERVTIEANSSSVEVKDLSVISEKKVPMIDTQAFFESTKASVIDSEDESSEVAPTKNRTKIIIFSAALLLVIILFLLVERFMVKQQEE